MYFEISSAHLLHCRLMYFHVAIFADQTYQMCPRKSDRQSKIVHLPCGLHTIHWQLSMTIHTLANQRLRRTIPMDRLPLQTIPAPQFQRKSTIISPFWSPVSPKTEKQMMFFSARMKLFILMHRCEMAHLSNAITIINFF